MSIPPKPFSSSQNIRRNSPERSAPLKWLGPSDEIPDLSFAAFLQIMHEYFPQLPYTRESFNYARFSHRGQHPNDPEAITFPIKAREQGTIVGSDDIIGLLETFSVDVQEFKNACNTFYKLKPDHEN